MSGAGHGDMVGKGSLLGSEMPHPPPGESTRRMRQQGSDVLRANGESSHPMMGFFDPTRHSFIHGSEGIRVEAPAV